MTGNLPNGTTQRDLDAAIDEPREDVCECCGTRLEWTACKPCKGRGGAWLLCIDCRGTGRGELICPQCDGEE